MGPPDSHATRAVGVVGDRCTARSEPPRHGTRSRRGRRCWPVRRLAGRQGYDVTLVDPSKSQRVRTEKIAEHGYEERVAVEASDVRDLELDRDVFDATLCLGDRFRIYSTLTNGQPPYPSCTG